MRDWARRTSTLHQELSAIASVDVRWWLFAGGAAAAEPWRARVGYVLSDAEPSADTFIGQCSLVPADPVRDAIARAHAARLAIRDLDGHLPDQRLAVTLHRDPARGAATLPSALEVAAFAIGDRCVIAPLAGDVADETALAASLSRALAAGPGDAVVTRFPSDGTPLAAPFVTISIGDEPIATARHGHRRGWIGNTGPWLGLGRTGELAVVSTCHMVLDGYGHTLLTSRIAEHWARLYGGHERVKGALLVGPTDPEAMQTVSLYPVLGSMAPLPMQELPFPALVVASEDDPYVTFERAGEMAEAWGAELISAGEAGHINVASGHGEWADGEVLLSECLHAWTPPEISRF